MYYAFVVQYCFPKMCEGRSGACCEPQVGIRLDLICLRLSFSARNAGFHSLLLGASPQITMMIPNSTLHGDRLMKCPVCNSDLQMSERSGVEIDFCPACRGVWLDRGELDKIIERSGRDTECGQLSTDRERHFGSSDDSASQHAPHPKKRESFWSDLFDFG